MSSNILPMPVAAAVLRGAPIKDHNPEDMRTVIDRVGLIRAAAREATLVHAQPAADMYWLTTDFYDKVSDFPPLRLPFPLMWFEWRMPDRFLNQEGWHDTSAGTARNVFATANEAEPDPANPDPYPDGTYRVVSIDGGWLKDDGTVEILPGILFANINEQGQVLGVVSDGDFFDGLGALGVDDESIEFIAGTLRPAALAVGLMNCKNVHTEQRSTGNVFNRKKRKRSPKLDYHVIVLPSPAGDSEGAGGHRDVRQHKVRGHFKTYTADKPLMGRHVGTYWFAWHLRGDAERGRIIADYKLKRDGMMPPVSSSSRRGSGSRSTTTTPRPARRRSTTIPRSPTTRCSRSPSRTSAGAPANDEGPEANHRLGALSFDHVRVMRRRRGRETVEHVVGRTPTRTPTSSISGVFVGVGRCRQTASDLRRLDTR